MRTCGRVSPEPFHPVSGSGRSGSCRSNSSSQRPELALPDCVVLRSSSEMRAMVIARALAKQAGQIKSAEFMLAVKSRSVSARYRELDSFDQRRLGLARREIGERIDGPAAVLARALDRVRQRVGGSKQRDRLREVVVRNALASHCRAPECALRFAAAGVSEDYREGHLAVAEVIADTFAHGRCIGRIIDHIVSELEGNPEILAERFERKL